MSINKCKAYLIRGVQLPTDWTGVTALFPDLECQLNPNKAILRSPLLQTLLAEGVIAVECDLCLVLHADHALALVELGDGHRTNDQIRQVQH